MKIFHHNDLDGRCAGAIAWRFLAQDYTGVYYSRTPNTEIIEVDYKDDLQPLIDKILPGERVVIVDFSFFKDDMEKVLEKTNDIIWIDHHKTVIGRKYSKEVKGLRSTEHSGCELTWMYCVGGQMPRSVELIGDMDTWKWKYGIETERFCEGLKLYDHHPNNYIWEELFSDQSFDLLKALGDEGKIAIKYRESFCKEYRASYGFETLFEGYKTYVVGLPGFGSKLFGDKIKEYPLCMNFEYDGKKWEIGIYSETVDVSEIAVKYNGGGHKGAGGWVTDKFPWI